MSICGGGVGVSEGKVRGEWVMVGEVEVSVSVSVSVSEGDNGC